MILLGNGRLVTRDDATPFFDDGAVLIDGKTIVAVGQAGALKAQHPGAEFIDAKGGVIMPGLINVHNHIYSAFARGMSIKNAPTRNFIEILDNLWWTLDRHLLLKDTQASADATFIDCIENGCTAIVDHHASYGETAGSLFAIEESARQYGVRASLCYEVSDRNGEEAFRAAVKENTDFIRHAKKDESGMIHALFGMHAQFTLSDKSMRYCVEQNVDGAGYHIHVSEGIDDVTLCLKEHGKTPVYRLLDYGILGEHSIAGHCTHVTEAEMNLLKELGVMVAHNPESNMGNAIGCPPSIRIYGKGIIIGLGTDGYTNDMIESYKVANILHKHHLCDPTVAWGEVPGMLFQNNAKMASKFFGREMGVLKPGAAADVIVMDYVPLTPMHAGDINSHVLFGMNGRNCRTTIINGEVKMKDRELVGVDKEAVMAHCRERAQGVWHRINEGR